MEKAGSGGRKERGKEGGGVDAGEESLELGKGEVGKGKGGRKSERISRKSHDRERMTGRPMKMFSDGNVPWNRKHVKGMSNCLKGNIY